MLKSKSYLQQHTEYSLLPACVLFHGKFNYSKKVEQNEAFLLQITDLITLINNQAVQLYKFDNASK